ncbi:MAG: precorrin-6y C5,15-methyltransferase (decarboxylating) subunit CbiE [Thermoprotei archaeon]
MDRVAGPKVYIVGVGPGSPKYLTPRAREAVRHSQIVLGWELDLAPIRSLLRGKEVYIQNVSNYKEVAVRVAEVAKREWKTVAVARIGDPCVSSGLNGLLEAFSGFDIEIIPGISSVQLAASIARINIDDSVVVSFHDYGDHEAEKNFMLEAFKAGKHLIVLTSPDLSPSGVADFLVSKGCEPTTPVVVCSNLTLEGEKIEHSTLGGIIGKSFHWLSLVTVVNPSVPTENEAYFRWKKWREVWGRDKPITNTSGATG